MYDEQTIVLRDKIYVPANTVDRIRVLNKYVHNIYDNQTCARCDNKINRHNYICEECPAFRGRIATCKEVVKNNIDYIGIPIGDRLIFERKVGIDIDDYRIVDKRVKNRFRYPIRMRKSFKLYDYQKEAVESWKEYMHGLIVAPPRSGKTPSLLSLLIELGYRCIVLAHQHEFLNQFLEHVEEYTNLPILERKTGEKLFGFPKKITDFEKFEICVCTYQQFVSEINGRKRFEAAASNFGSLAVDECFVYDTRVLIDFDGNYEKIGDIVDKGLSTNVVSYNHKSNSFELKAIESITRKETVELFDIEYEGGVIRCTGNHEFWCVNRNSYVRASELTEDDELLVY